MTANQLLDFVQCSQAASADVQAGALPFDYQGFLVRIRLPAPIGSSLGVTYVMSKLRRFTADITLAGHQIHPLAGRLVCHERTLYHRSWPLTNLRLLVTIARYRVARLG